MLYAAIIDRADGSTDYHIIAADTEVIAGEYAEELLGEGDELSEITADVEAIVVEQYDNIATLCIGD